MQFDSMQEFLAMGEHGLYVWLAYGATTLLLLGYPIARHLANQRLLAELKWQVDDVNQSEECPK